MRRADNFTPLEISQDFTPRVPAFGRYATFGQGLHL